jgi:zinc protease
MLGGSISHIVGSETFGWSISVPSAHRAGAAELLADVVQHPALDAESLETERTVAMADVVALRDDMHRYPIRLALEQAFAGHPYGRSVLGSEESLRRVDIEHVRDWHTRYVLGGSSVVVVVSDGEPQEIADATGSHFDALGRNDPWPVVRPAWPAGAAVAVEHRDRAQTALALVFPGPDRLDRERYTASMLTSVASGLGGRFFEELRDRQSLSYTVHVQSADRRAAGAFIAYMATSPELEDAAREGLLREFRRFAEEPVTEEELERAQTYAIGVHHIRQQSGGAVLGEVADAWLFGTLSDLSDFEGEVRAVTRERIQALAARSFDPARRVEGVVRGTGKAV